MGGIYLVVCAPLFVAPGLARRVLAAFPRHAWAGRVLAAVAVAGSAWQVNAMPLGMFDAYKFLLWAVAPLTYGLVLLFMEELLAARALGGALLLAASPVLELVRWHPSAWRLLPVVLAYTWVIAGIMLVLSPFKFRKTAEWACATDARCRFWGGLGVALGALLALIPWLVTG
jgi:hypothetical protein